MSGIQLGLERMKLLMERLGHPESQLKIIHVAGTNGKGSVCACLSSILVAAGFKVGRFNSPHFLSVEDSITINHKPVPDLHAVRDWIRRETRHIAATSFELMTALAFTLFQRNKVDLVVLEVGVGGRLDATNICPPPLVAVITSIGMDHMDLLGDTVTKIAREKAGILKQGTKGVVLSQQKYAEVYDMIKEHVPSDAKLVQCTPASTELSSDGQRHSSIDFNGEIIEFPVKLLGDFQLENSAAAVFAAKCLGEVDARFNITNDQIYQGMSAVEWLGRLDRIHYQGKTFIVDGAHNPEGAIQLGNFIKDTFRASRKRVTWIMGFKQGKDVESITKHLVKSGDLVITSLFTQPDEMPWVKPSPLIDIRTVLGSQEIQLEVDIIDKAMDYIRELEGGEDRVYVVSGSLYLAADFYRYLRKNGFQWSVV
jgi:folylpolyglutamate synthase/dihydrofolate synthase